MAERDPLNLVGQVVAEKYRIERLVGEGGFAVVYLAEHTIWKKPVAIKFFNGLSSAPVDQRDELQKAFIQEGALLTDLSSHTANIVQARDVGTYTSPDGQWMPFMVLEWLEGSALDEWLETEHAQGLPPWSVEQVRDFLAPVCSALEVAHRKGIAHRDIKPANLFVVGGDPREGNVNVKVLDFGVAKMMSENTHMKAALAKTGTSITSFTPQYGAPEQFSRSHGATGPWTDVFAAALVGVELLTGQPALDGDDLVQLGYAAGNPHARPTPRQRGVQVSDAVEQVFAQALAPKPAERFPSAGPFWQALDAAISGRPLSASPATIPAGSSLMPRVSVTPVSRPDASAHDATVLATGPGLSTTAGESGNNRLPLVLGGVVALAAIVAGAFFFLRTGNDSDAAAQVPAASASAPTPSASVAAEPPPACPEDMKQIPAGQYFMGSDDASALDNEKPPHQVKLDSFCIDMHEVTTAKYKACSDVGKCRRASKQVDWPDITDEDRKTYGPLCTMNDPEKYAQHPINCVTWDMADHFCRQQNKRLPTEAEWEYATRGPDGRIYPWGDEAPTAKHVNACGSECVEWGKQHDVELASLYDTDDGYPNTAPVGSFPAGSSRFGPHDVAGNVWEWVNDWYGDYGPGASSNPTGPTAGDKRVIRGGAWNGGYATWLRPSFRYRQVPGAKSYGIGFRCAAEVSAGDTAR